MRLDAKQAEERAILDTACAMCAAIRTAPKAHGTDTLDAIVLTGEDKDALAAKMRAMGEANGQAFFLRDASCVERSTAIVLAGAKNVRRGLNECCKLCAYDGCGPCAKANGLCVFGPVDLGIALGSAVALASDRHIDNRIFFSAGQAAMALGTLSGGWRIVRTMGSKITRLTPMQGFCAETGGALTLFGATWLGIPVSTTHTITGAIVGVGAARRVSAVRWNIAGDIVIAWILTIPAAALIGALFYEITRLFG